MGYQQTLPNKHTFIAKTRLRRCRERSFQNAEVEEGEAAAKSVPPLGLDLGDLGLHEVALRQRLQREGLARSRVGHERDVAGGPQAEVAALGEVRFAHLKFTCCEMNAWLLKSASVQPGTSRLKSGKR